MEIGLGHPRTESDEISFSILIESQGDLVWASPEQNLVDFHLDLNRP